MTPTLTELRNRYDELRKAKKELFNDVNQESGQQLLLQIRAAGGYLTDHFEREQYAQLARDVADRLLELTGEYYPVRLIPLDVNITDRIAISHESVNVNVHEDVALSITSNANIAIPFLAPPRPSIHFIGRERLLNELKHQLVKGGFYAFQGLPGVGKTAIAVELAHDREMLAHFIDGVLWAGLGVKADIRMHLSMWGKALGIPSSQMAHLDQEDQIKTLHNAIGMRRMLLIIDDVWHVEDALTFQIGGPNCAHIVTTRIPEVALKFANENAKSIYELNNEEGLELLKQFALEAVDSEPKDALALVKAVDGLPLSLVLMGRRLQIESHSKQPRRIRDALNQLSSVEARLNLSQPQTASMRIHSLSISTPFSLLVNIQISVELLDSDAQQMLLALSIFPPKPNSFSEEAALAIAHRSATVLDQLVDSGLVESRGFEYYSLHQTIADYGRTQLKDEKLVRRRMVEYFVRFVEEHKENLILLDRELPNVTAALQIAFEEGIFVELIHGDLEWAELLERVGNYDQARELLTQTQQVTVLEGNEQSLVTVLYRLGSIEGRQGNYKSAETYLQKALVKARTFDDHVNMVRLLQRLGSIAFRQDNYDQAEKYIQEGLVHAHKINDKVGICYLLGTLGSITRKFGDFKQAEAYLQEGLALAREIENIERVSALLNNLGSVNADLGNYLSAKVYWSEGLELARQISAQQAISTFLSNLGMVEDSLGNPLQAEEYLLEGLALARKIGDREGTCYLLTNLGEVKITLGHYDAAEALYHQGLNFAEELGDKDMMSYLFGGLGKLKSVQQEPEQAEQYLQKGLRLARELKDDRLISILLNAWGEFYIEQEEEDLAYKNFEEALYTAQKHGLQEQIGDALYGLGLVKNAQNNNKDARRLGEESLRIFEMIGYYKAKKVNAWLFAIALKDTKEN